MLARAGLVVLGVLLVALLVTVGPSLIARPPQPTAPPTAAIVTASPTPTRPASPTPTASPAPTALVSVRGNIIVEQPRGFARTRSPLQIAGQVRAFEATYQWRIVDLGGAELGKGFGTASRAGPEFGTFAVTVTFTVTIETSAYVEVFTISARDGSVDEIVRVPVTLIP